MRPFTRFPTALFAFVLALMAISSGLAAQDHPPAAQPAAAQHAEQKAEAPVDIITPHITDSHHLEIPWFKPPFHFELELPRWTPVHVGPVTVDLSPTKHVVFGLLAAILAATLLLYTASAHKRQTEKEGTPRGLAAAVEAVVLYLRNEIILPNVGPHGEGFVPLCISFFFFILFANLLGIVPWGSTATGNISVTAALAVVAFVTVEVAGMRALGWGYMKTIVYWPHDMSLPMKSGMTLIMTPVELLGKFIKPVALALRLFANMTGGHIVLLALVSLIFLFPKVWFLPVGFSVAILLLETFVAFLQAFVFTLLTAVFIGLVRAEHH